MVSNKGFNEGFITLYANAADVGKAVKISANNTCAACAADEKPIGFLVNERCGIGSVQVTGHATVKYSGSVPALGACIIAADGNGGIKCAADGTAVTVLSVDTAENTAEILL